MKKEIFKKCLPYAVALVVFIVLTLVYASPILDGKVLNAGDTKGWQGMSQEIRDYREDGNESLWLGSMFSGMPSYQVTATYPSSGFKSTLSKIVLLGVNGTLGVLFCLFIGYFIMLRAFKVNEWLSIVGAIAIALSSYFILIIPAGHTTKAVALGYLPAVIGGFYL